VPVPATLNIKEDLMMRVYDKYDGDEEEEPPWYTQQMSRHATNTLQQTISSRKAVGQNKSTEKAISICSSHRKQEEDRLAKYRHPKKYSGMYIQQFAQFSDIFTGMRTESQTKVSSRGTPIIPKAHKSRRRQANRAADEKELIAYMTLSVEKWFVDMDTYCHSLSSNKQVINISSLSPRAIEVVSPSSISSGMFYVARQTRGRREVVDIVTETMSKIGGWENLPDFVSSAHGAHLWNLMWTWSRPKVN
jgi:hypothetical protein